MFVPLKVLGIKLPNMLGRGEKLTFQFSYGTKETSYGLSFFKPQSGFYERKYDFCKQHSTLKGKCVIIFNVKMQLHSSVITINITLMFNNLTSLLCVASL